MKCKIHKECEITEKCSKCGKDICLKCAVDYYGKLICVECGMPLMSLWGNLHGEPRTTIEKK